MDACCTAEQYSCILGRRLLYSCTWPAITTHHLTRQALRARVDLVGLHVLHFTLHKPLTSHTFTRTRHCRHGLASSLRLAPTAHTDPRHLQSTDVVPAKQTSEMHISHLYILLHAATTSVTKDAHTQHVKGNNCLYRLEITPSEQTSTTLQRASTTKHPLQQIARNQIFLTS